MSAREFKYILERANLTLAQAAAKLHVTARTISRWKAGKSQIDLWHATDIRRKLATWEATESLAERVRRERLLYDLEITGE